MTATEISTTNTTETQFDPAKAEAFGGQMNAGCAAVRALPRSGPAVPRIRHRAAAARLNRGALTRMAVLE